MSGRNPPDPFGDARAEQAQRRLNNFCDALIAAGDKPGVNNMLRWPPFLSRAGVKKALAWRGYELCEESANHDPALKRFFAMRLAKQAKESP